mgnify:CR=1 FL=1
MSRLKWLAVPALALLFCGLAFGAYRLFAGSPDRRIVVVYVSTDQEIAEPILQAFGIRTGIRVEAVYDSEATKTAGLGLRLLAERGRPRADVFWASEPTRLLRLGREGVLADYRPPEAEGLPDWARGQYWTAFSSRTRVILVNTDLVPEGRRPRRLEDLLDPAWKGRICIGDPRFGTTSTHAAALGDGGIAFARRLRENGVRLCAGNAMVREMVERGELAMGLTDSDDAWAALDRGLPVAMVVPEPALLIPNAAALIAGAPHPEEGRLLLDFLVSAEVEGRLALKPMRQLPLRASVPVPEGVGRLADLRILPVDWENLGGKVEGAASAFYEAVRP